jgi:acylphosphatase
MKRVHLIVAGDVVGVGFRAWVLRMAKELHLTGWVKNRDNGTVELVAEGSSQSLAILVDQSRHGPQLAHVKNVTVEWQKETGEFITFQVIY